MDELNEFCPRTHEQTTPTDLRDGHQIWHTLKVVGREISVTSRFDLLQSLVNFGTEFLLAFAVLNQLPECKGQLKNP